MISSNRLLLTSLVLAAAAAPLAYGASAKPKIGQQPTKSLHQKPNACIGNTQPVTETGATRALAEGKAITRWSQNWAPSHSWSTAQDKSVSCKAIPGGWSCSAYATPCTVIRHNQ